MIKISPSILSADFACMGQAVAALEGWGADYVHCDIMDGRFVPPITFGEQMVAALRPYSSLFFDVHLMVKDPEHMFEAFAKAGAQLLSIHPEACGDFEEALKQIHALGMKTGAVLNPETPLSAIDGLLDQIDLVLVMGVHPGYGGQKFIPETIKKVADVRALLADRPIQIEIDGGVNLATGKELVRAGADVLVSGSTIFGADDPSRMIAEMKALTRE